MAIWKSDLIEMSNRITAERLYDEMKATGKQLDQILDDGAKQMQELLFGRDPGDENDNETQTLQT